jgi:hypothetical protein
MELRVEYRGIDAVRAQLLDLSNNMPKEIAIAGTETAKKARKMIARKLATVIRQPIKNLLKATYYKSRSDGVLIRIRSFEIALRRFKPTQNKQGVSVATRRGAFNASTLKKQTIKDNYPGAFMGPNPKKRSPKLRGNPVKRVGRSRLPIKALPAVSVVATTDQSGLTQILAEEIKVEYGKQILERVRMLTLKKQKKLTWQVAGKSA